MIKYLYYKVTTRDRKTKEETEHKRSCFEWSSQWKKSRASSIIWGVAATVIPEDREVCRVDYSFDEWMIR